MTDVRFWTVAVEAPLPEALTYKSQNSKLNGCEVSRGMLVSVQLGKRTVRGVVLKEQTLSEAQTAADKYNFSLADIKEIVKVETEYPALPEPTLSWLEWIAKYYIYPIGQVCGLAYPSLEKTQKQRKSQRPAVVPDFELEVRPNLTAEQSVVLQDLKKFSSFSTHLLFGVTGSGKTEIYLRLIEDTLALGKTSLFLVPEISLTPQLVHRFAKRFGQKVAVLHSQLTDRERTNQWWEIISGEKKILIGARSALFCPLDNLGMIVVDEEHESSYKQDEKLKYNGRDCAIVLGKHFNIPVILGSATPSLETWKNCLDQKYHLHYLTKRVYDQIPPVITIIDMKKEAQNISGLPRWLSQELFEKITEALAKKQQAALLLNRRGLAQVVMCKKCGHTSKCPNCEISLTLHQKSHLICHYCDYRETLVEDCPQCREGELTPLGVGTEQVEQDLIKLFPNSRIARADRDEIQSRLEMEDLIGEMEDGKIDILVGTQMIAKGLDFKKLYIVGFVLADIGLNMPDFRSTERNFQLITQMSGRAGRHLSDDGSIGEVFIQAFNIDHPSLLFAQTYQLQQFFSDELKNREALSYPPYGKIVCLRIQGPNSYDLQTCSEMLKTRASRLIASHEKYSVVQALGPAQSPLSKLRGNFRQQMLLKSTNGMILNLFTRHLIRDLKLPRPQVKVIIDVDPQHLL